MASKIAEQLQKLKLPSIESSSNEGEAEHTVHAKLFGLACAATWLIIGYDPPEDPSDPEDEGLVFCYADLHGQGRAGGAEWGYSSVAEMSALKWAGIPRVELDTNFKPLPFTKCVNGDGKIIV